MAQLYNELKKQLEVINFKLPHWSIKIVDKSTIFFFFFFMIPLLIAISHWIGGEPKSLDESC